MATIAARTGENLHGTVVEGAAQASRLLCPRCERTFKRLGHLKRHMKAHDGPGRFQCHVCNKLFARSDILAKHAATHGSSLSGVNALSCRPRACLECARTRERCTKSAPCLRCSNRNLRCVYPDDLDRAAAAAAVPGTYVVQDDSSEQIKILDAVENELMVPTSGEAAPNQPSWSRTPPPPPPWTADELSPSSGPRPPDHGQQAVASREGFDFTLPINWLPVNPFADLTFDSMFNLIMSPDAPQDGSTGGTFAPVPDDNEHLTAAQTSPQPTWPTARTVLSPTSNKRPATAATSTSPLSLSADIASSSSTTGDLYATSSHGARNPCTTRAKIFNQSTLRQHYQDLEPLESCTTAGRPQGFPTLVDDSVAADYLAAHTCFRLDAFTYNIITRKFADFCLDLPNTSRAFSSRAFPSLDVLNLFLRLYFEHFDPLFSVFHLPSFNVNRSWILATAICAIGSQFSMAKELTACAAPLLEFCHRVLNDETIHETWSDPDDTIKLQTMQSLLLLQIGLTYCGNAELHALAVARRWQLFSLVERAPLSKFAPPRASHDASADGPQEWIDWAFAETWRRLYYYIWVLDCILSYGYNTKMSPDIGLCDEELPHNEDLWRATTHVSWSCAINIFQRPPSLSEATNTLFREKQVSRDLGELAHLVLLHQVYREIDQVSQYQRRQLFTWIPRPDYQHTASAENDGDGTNLVRNFRNAALDCVDVLHWAAMAKVASLSGAEHPMVLHLHFSRVVLLAPRTALMTLAKSVAASQHLLKDQHPATTKEQAAAAEREISEWVLRDECKARLAVLHCGCLIWHIRRYSSLAFYEPAAVFFATLTIWAYGCYTPRNNSAVTKAASNEHTRAVHDNAARQAATHDEFRADQAATAVVEQSSPLDDDVPPPSGTYHYPAPSFIRLDRPNDDEMVQLFVQSGRPSTMTAYISNVGDVCGTNGPLRMLKEGRHLLEQVSRCWVRNPEYLFMLLGLEQASLSRP